MNKIYQATEKEFLLIRNLIENESGILLGDNKQYLLENRLSPLVSEENCNSFNDLYLKAMNPTYSDLKRKIVEHIAINETFWFRNEKHFKILEQEIIGDYINRIQEGKQSGINIWSAACSTGQEPYSILMTLYKYYEQINRLSRIKDEVRLLASDYSSKVVNKASLGVYEINSTRRGLSDTHLSKFFNKDLNSWEIINDLKELVEFKEINLKDRLNYFHTFDIIFLRNITIYFSAEFAKEVLSKITSCLKPGGYLFLGTGEDVHDSKHYYKVIQSEKIQYYQKH
jgi:chemotaxis protein methyltransferase CheR